MTRSKTTRASKNWLVYILRCKDKSYYTGITTDLKKRLAAHNDGNGAKYTRSRRPVKLMAKTSLMLQREAMRLEIKIKRMPKEKKLKALKAVNCGVSFGRSGKDSGRKSPGLTGTKKKVLLVD